MSSWKIGRTLTRPAFCSAAANSPIMYAPMNSCGGEGSIRQDRCHDHYRAGWRSFTDCIDDCAYSLYAGGSNIDFELRRVSAQQCSLCSARNRTAHAYDSCKSFCGICPSSSSSTFPCHASDNWLEFPRIGSGTWPTVHRPADSATTTTFFFGRLSD
jgi:hypothetical protein